ISVPKISVTEYRDFSSKKNNIRFSKNRLIVPCKRSNPMANKLPAQKFFQCGITIAHPAHIFMYLFSTLFVSHCASLQLSRYRPINCEAFDFRYKILALFSIRQTFSLLSHAVFMQSRYMKSSFSESIASQSMRRTGQYHS